MSCDVFVEGDVQECRNAMQVCAMPIAMEFMGLSEAEAIEKIRNTDLRETCEYVHVPDVYIDMSIMININIVQNLDSCNVQEIRAIARKTARCVIYASVVTTALCNSPPLTIKSGMAQL